MYGFMVPVPKSCNHRVQDLTYLHTHGYSLCLTLTLGIGYPLPSARRRSTSTPGAVFLLLKRLALVLRTPPPAVVLVRLEVQPCGEGVAAAERVPSLANATSRPLAGQRSPNRRVWTPCCVWKAGRLQHGRGYPARLVDDHSPRTIHMWTSPTPTSSPTTESGPKNKSHPCRRCPWRASRPTWSTECL